MWVHAVCWVLGGAVVVSGRVTTGCSGMILLHLLFLELLAWVSVKGPCLVLGCVRGWQVFGGVLHCMGRLGVCGVVVVVGVGGVVVRGCDDL